MSEELPREAKAELKSTAKKLEATSWGVFFVWIGVVFLAGIPAGWALAVIGLITLAAQVARVAFGLRFEGFWIVVGSCFLLGGIWQLIQAQLPLFPVLLILAGIAMILATFWPEVWRRKHA
jgi:hypothetical protein